MCIGFIREAGDIRPDKSGEAVFMCKGVGYSTGTFHSREPFCRKCGILDGDKFSTEVIYSLAVSKSHPGGVPVIYTFAHPACDCYITLHLDANKEAEFRSKYLPEHVLDSFDIDIDSNGFIQSGVNVEESKVLEWVLSALGMEASGETERQTRVEEEARLAELAEEEKTAEIERLGIVREEREKAAIKQYLDSHKSAATVEKESNIVNALRRFRDSDDSRLNQLFEDYINGPYIEYADKLDSMPEKADDFTTQ